MGTVLRVELADMKAPGIVFLDRAMLIVPLIDVAVTVSPPMTIATARTQRLGLHFLRSRESPQRTGRGYRLPG